MDARLASKVSRGIGEEPLNEHISARRVLQKKTGTVHRVVVKRAGVWLVLHPYCATLKLSER